MSDDVKRMWVAALRSGKYVQGTGVLHDKDGKCCALGVLCELAVEAEVVGRCEDESGDMLYGKPNSLWRGVLPPDVQDWAGFNGSPSWIATMNDGEKLTFEQIADRIEKVFELEVK
jgi:hypothetical protein